MFFYLSFNVSFKLNKVRVKYCVGYRILYSSVQVRPKERLESSEVSKPTEKCNNGSFQSQSASCEREVQQVQGLGCVNSSKPAKVTVFIIAKVKIVVNMKSQ